MTKRTRFVMAGVALVLAGGVGMFAFNAWSQEHRHGFGPRMHGMGPGMMRMGPGMGMGPGMMMGSGPNAATANEMRDIHAMFARNDLIKRTVTNLPDGIRTVTESDDPQTAQIIKTHVADMRKRVNEGRDPGLPIESPALRAIFKNKDKIRTNMEMTAKGVVMVQTSDDPETVKLLQTHAAEVSEFVRGGMAAMHTAMMRNGGMMANRMHRMMQGTPRDDAPHAR